MDRSSTKAKLYLNIWQRKETVRNLFAAAQIITEQQSLIQNSDKLFAKRFKTIKEHGIDSLLISKPIGHTNESLQKEKDEREPMQHYTNSNKKKLISSFTKAITNNK